MEYAIIELGGHQFWVEEGKHFLTNKICAEPGTNILINRVLLLKKDGAAKIGYPYLNNTKVRGQILEHSRGPKINVYKMKSKKNYRRKIGHRQELTKILIKTIEK
nr:ribosomal protein L21 [Meringosphaera mediterranea]WLD06289.1 ribosomal protein L21 [Meringosphaera mediterranea]